MNPYRIVLNGYIHITITQFIQGLFLADFFPAAVLHRLTKHFNLSFSILDIFLLVFFLP